MGRGKGEKKGNKLYMFLEGVFLPSQQGKGSCIQSIINKKEGGETGSIIFILLHIFCTKKEGEF